MSMRPRPRPLLAVLLAVVTVLAAVTAAADTSTTGPSGMARRFLRLTADPVACRAGDVWANITTGLFKGCTADNTVATFSTGGGGGGAGDVVGPAAATDNAIVVYDGTTGKLIKDTTVTLQSGVFSNVANGSVGTGTPALSAVNGSGIMFTTTGIGVYSVTSSKAGTLDMSGLTANRIFTFPNVAGTVALTTSTVSAATALAANPSDCAAGQFATTIAASGNLTCAAVGAATNLTISTGVTSGTGMQHVRGASCSTLGIINASCDTTVTWPVAFADTSYTAVATLDSPTGGLVFIVSTKNKTTTTIDVTLVTLTAAVSSGTINLIGMHD